MKFLACLALSLLCFAVAPSGFAQACDGDESNCFTFDPNNTSFTYSFSDAGGSTLTVQFETVLHAFDLRVGIHLPKPTDSSFFCDGPCSPIQLDPKEFPANTICVNYPGNTPGTCEQYDFTGHSAFSSGPNGVPVKNIDYKGLITLTLQYSLGDSFTVRDPAFGHAPGEQTTFTEDILTSYFEEVPDPGMGGRTPGLSSVVALDEPAENNLACPLILTSTNVASGQKPQLEVQLRIVSPTSTCSPGTGLRDKSARLSVSMLSGGALTFPALKNTEGNKFHWDSKNSLNEYDISLEGLADGTYTITVFSNKFSPPLSEKFCVSGGNICP